MDWKEIKKINESYHKGDRIQKRIVTRKNFTYRHLLDLISKYLKNDMEIADYGCGVGTIDFYLASLKNRVTGVDFSNKAIMLARVNSKVLGTNRYTKFIVKNFPEDKFYGSYDLVLMTEIIEHLRDDTKAFETVQKVLKKGGVLIVSTRNIKAPLNRIGLTRSHDKRVGHLRRYNPKDLKALALMSKLKVIEQGEMEGLLRDFLFSYPSLGSQIVRVANKLGFFSDFLTLLDWIFLKLFGPSQVYIVAKR
jgi:2-polyprenyl-3-methyl-5-hydroxy-6-metoxy-1,4-benzoquinol methylase